MNIIYLVGMPAAGKTYWGTQLAAAFHFLFVDLDAYIVKREQQDIPGLFAYGEDWFRGKEHAALIEIIHQTKQTTIVATGGGTPCFFNNLKQMQRSGQIIYLESKIETLVSRLVMDGETRPLLRGKHNVYAALQELLKGREPYYKQANYILQSEDITLTNFEQIIIECTNKLSQQGLSLQW